MRLRNLIVRICSSILLCISLQVLAILGVAAEMRISLQALVVLGVVTEMQRATKDYQS